MAAKKIGLVLALDGEKEFKSAIKAVKEEVKLYGDSIKNLDKAFASNRNSAEALSKKQEALTKKQEAYIKQLEAAKNGLDNAKKQYQDQTTALEKLKSKLDDAERELKQMADAGDTNSDAYKKQKDEVERLTTAVSKQSTNVNTAQARINQWTREVNNSEAALNECNAELRQNEKYLDEAARAADGCATSIDKFGDEVNDAEDDTQELNVSLKDMVKNKLVDLGGDTLVDLGRRAIEAAKYVIDVGSSFEAAMSRVQAISGASSGEIAKLSALAQEMGRTTKFTATESADALNYMAMAGWKTDDMLQGLEGIMNLAAASGADLAITSDIVTDALTAFGASASESGRLADIMAAASSNANTNVEMMGETFKYAAPVAGALGYTMEDTALAIGLMANAGIKSSQAGTALRSGMTRLVSPTKQAQEAMDKYGISITDSDGKMLTFHDMMEQLRVKLGGLDEAEQASAASAIFGKNAMSGWLAVLNSSDEDFDALAESIYNSDGAAKSMAETMQNNLAGKMTLLNSALEGLGIAVYGYVSGPLQGVVSTVTDIISGITAAISPQKTELQSFIESVELANAEVERTLTSAKNTVANAEAEVAGLESAKNFLEGILNNCKQFNETDLSVGANKIESGTGKAKGSFEDLDKAAGNANSTIEGVGENGMSPDHVGEDAAEIETGLTKIETAAGEAQTAIDDVGNQTIDDTNIGTFSATAETELGDVETAAGEAKTAVEGTGDAELDGSAYNDATSQMVASLGTVTSAAGETKTAVEETDDTELDGSKLNEESITTPLGTITAKAGEAITAVSNVSDAELTDTTIKEGTAAIVSDMTEAAQAAGEAEEAIKKPGLVKAVTIKGKIPTATDDIAEAEEKVKTGAEDATEAVGKIGENVEGITSTTEALGYMKDAQEGVVIVTDEFTKSRITNVVNQLKDTVPELADAWDENTGELRLTNEQLAEYITNAEKAIKAEAYSESLKAIWKAIADAEFEEARAKSAQKAAQADYNSAVESGTELQAQYGSEYIDLSVSAGTAKKTLDDANDAVDEASKNAKIAHETYTEYSAVMEEMGYTVEGDTVVIEGNTEAQAENTATTAQAVDQKQLLADALDALEMAELETTETTEGLTQAQAESAKAFQEMAHLTTDELLEMMETMGMSASEFADWCQEQIDGIEQLKSDYDSLLSSVTDALKGYVENLDTSGEEGTRAIDNMVTHLQEKTTSLQTWVENMKELGAMAGDGLPQSLYDHLLAEGPDKTMEAVQALVDAAHSGDEKFAQVADEWNKGLAIEAEAVVLVSYSQTGKDYAAAVAAGFIGTEAEYDKTVQDLINSGVITAKSSAGDYEAAGAAGGKSAAEGISSEQNAVTEASKAVVDAGIESATTASDMFKSVGQIAMLALSGGMNMKKDTVTDRVKKIIEEASKQAKTSSETKFKDPGKAAVEAYANAIKNNANLATTQAGDAATKAGEAAKAKEYLFKNAGESAVKAYGNAIKTGSVVSSAQALAAATSAGEAIDKRRYMFTGAGQEAIQAFSAGMSTTKHISTAQALAAATDAGNAIDKRRYMFTGAGQEAISAFGSGISTTKHISTAQALAAATDAGSAVDKRRYMFSGAGTEAINAFASGISGSAGNATNAAGNASLNAANSARGYYSSFYYAGTYVSDGFAAGINASAYKAAAAAANVAAQALASAKARIGVASPSKEFIKVGKFVDEGFALGIERNQRLIEDAATKASKATLDAAKNASITSRLDIVGAERLNQLTNVKAETSENARAMQSLNRGLKALSSLAESLVNPKQPNVTVMIGNREFKGYIVSTAIEGMGQAQKSIMRGVGA